MNLSQIKRNELIQTLEYLKQNVKENEIKSKIDEIELELNKKKYGLIWEEHEEKVDEELKTKIPIFKEDTSLEIIKDVNRPINFLIEGDNLHSLYLLEKTHKGKIDLIYIDPPYNTKNRDFVYNDKMIGEDDEYRHSKWLSFMAERLRRARKLLTEEGVIFIQIDDNEVAQLKILCDEILGEENFINIISVNMKNIAGASGGGEDKRFKKNCEYLLIYAKNYGLLPIFNGAYEMTEMSELIQKYIDEGVSWKYTSVLLYEGDKEYINSTVDGEGNEIKIYRRINPVIKSIKQVAKDENITEQEAYRKYGVKIFRTTNAQSSIRTRIIEARKEFDIKDPLISIEYKPKTGKNKDKLYEQFYKDDKCNLFVWLKDTSEVIDGRLYKKDLQGTYWNFTAGTKNLTKEGNVVFPNGKKPVDLLKRIITLYPKKDITVLDFFAGSGTTGHAVISQNEEDNGTRNFILCTNNENNICKDITYRRLKNVIEGYINDKGKEYKGILSNLKYYKTSYIDRYNFSNDEVELSDELMENIKELVMLENNVYIDNKKIMIAFNEKELEEILKNTNEIEKIYISSDILITNEQEEKINSAEIEIIEIPEYYFREEIEG